MLGVAGLALACQGIAAATPDLGELWRLVQEQQRTIESLQARLERTEAQLASAEEKAAMTEEKIAAVDDKAEAAAAALEDGGATAAGWAARTTLGGYGELHYNNLDTGKQVDFHRFVLYVGHQFNDRIRLFSEVEIEHALIEQDEPGAVELEQAWLEFDLTPHHHLRAGLDVLPIGIINQTHEPNTFFGVERNRVENVIIPSTWWEAGLGLNGELAAGWKYDLVLHSGLDTPASGGDAFRIRSGRNSVAEAEANDAAVTGRLRYTAIAGVELGVSAQYQQDVNQSQSGLDIAATLVEAHLDLRRGMFGLRALGARWDLDDGPAGLGPAANGRDEQLGYYIEPALYFRAPVGLPGELGVFARYSYVDDRAGMDAGTQVEEVFAGINYWPHPDVVFKFDVQSQLDAAADGFNLGLGYAF
ncbi:MAG: porin [Gammaproteobacteria bacterium]|nr:porin [Gammaproteobacteria bacterium]